LMKQPVGSPPMRRTAQPLRGRHEIMPGSPAGDLFVLARAALEGAVRNADDLIGLTAQPRRTRAA
jgi:hypothetical protein